MRTYFRVAGLALLALSGLLFSLAFTASASYAHQAAQAAAVITIPAGQTATIHLQAFCIDPGKPFPTSIVNPNVVATDPVRAGLFYAANKGYVDSDPRQVQQAIWYLQTGKWQKADHVRAQEIVDAAKDPANKPTDPAGATSLIDAIKANSVSTTLSINPPTGTTIDLASYGDGALAVKNITDAEIKVYLPFGTVFPPSDTTQQQEVAYASAVQQAPTLTPAPTNTAAPTSTAAPTNTAAPAPTATAAVPALPNTGGADGTANNWALLLFATGLLTLLSGVAMIRSSLVPSAARVK